MYYSQLTNPNGVCIVPSYSGMELEYLWYTCMRYMYARHGDPETSTNVTCIVTRTLHASHMPQCTASLWVTDARYTYTSHLCVRYICVTQAAMMKPTM